MSSDRGNMDVSRDSYWGQAGADYLLVSQGPRCDEALALDSAFLGHRAARHGLGGGLLVGSGTGLGDRIPQFDVLLGGPSSDGSLLISRGLTSYVSRRRSSWTRRAGTRTVPYTSDYPWFGLLAGFLRGSKDMASATADTNSCSLTRNVGRHGIIWRDRAGILSGPFFCPRRLVVLLANALATTRQTELASSLGLVPTPTSREPNDVGETSPPMYGAPRLIAPIHHKKARSLSPGLSERTGRPEDHATQLMKETA